MNAFFNINLYEYAQINHQAISEEKSLSPKERDFETIFSFGNGYIGTRNSLEEFYKQSLPGTFLANFYEKSSTDEYNLLVKMPDWTRIIISVEGGRLNLLQNNIIYNYRYIDLRSGCVVRSWKCADNDGRITSIKIIKYISLHNKHELGKTVLIKPENYNANISVLSGLDCNTADFGYLTNQNISINDCASLLLDAKYSNQKVMLLQKSTFSPSKTFNNSIIINNFDGSFEEWNWLAEIGKIYEIKSLVTVYKNENTKKLIKLCSKHILNLGENFFEQSAKNHIDKWQIRKKTSEVKIIGNKDDQKHMDFAIFHLINSGEFSGISHSIPARSLSGEAYKGHVFWDTEMFLVPFYTYTNPDIAKNLLLYRYNTLNGARKNAIKEGFKGASFAWESTDSGVETAPLKVNLPDGTVINILSGKYENHITSDIVFALWKYYEATYDNDFLENYGAEIIFEAARFSESIINLEDDGLYHISQVIGPDEYHEKIDDNTYTNYLIQNNFKVAIKTFELIKANNNEKLFELKEKIGLNEEEINNWKNYANKIYLGYDNDTKLFEQFKGYYKLEHIDLNQYEPRVIPMDVILGHENIKKTQIIKQADVLMFLYLFGEKFSFEEIKANYDFYEPRCSHGSSLSPSIHSIIAARLAKTDEAYKYFQQNAHIDIDNEFGNAFGGIHIASAGGIWLSAVMGFAGMCPDEKGLIFCPNLPKEWEAIEFSIKWRGACLLININRQTINILPLPVDSKRFNTMVSIGKNNWKEMKENETNICSFIENSWRWND